MDLELIKNKYKRIILFARFSVVFNAAMAAGKIVLGIFSQSFFLVFSGFYNIGLGLAKFFAVRTARETERAEITPGDVQKRHRTVYSVIGGILLVTAAVYMIYCVSVFLGGSGIRYSEIVAISIAAVTFTEIAVSVRGVVTTRRDRKPLLEAVKLTSVTSSLISLALTQSALLSFTHDGDVSFYNGITGIAVGAIGALIGIYMLFRMTPAVIEKYNLYLFKKIEKTAKSIAPDITLKFERLDDASDGAIKMYISSFACDVAVKAKIRELVLKEHSIELIF